VGVNDKTSIKATVTNSVDNSVTNSVINSATNSVANGAANTAANSVANSAANSVANGATNGVKDGVSVSDSVKDGVSVSDSDSDKCPLDCGGPPRYQCRSGLVCQIRNTAEYPESYGFCVDQASYTQWDGNCARQSCPSITCDTTREHYKFMTQDCCVSCKDGRGKGLDSSSSSSPVDSMEYSTVPAADMVGM